MRTPVSIIITSFNYAQYLEETINSVLDQTYPHWELIIVDDGSTDRSLQIIKHFIQKDNRIRLFQHKGNINKGLAKSLKLGIQNSSYDWIVFLESDDKLMPNYLETKINHLTQNPDLIYSDLETINSSSKIETYLNWLRTTILNKDTESFLIDNFNLLIKENNIIPTFSTVMLKKSLLKNFNYMPVCKTHLDYYLWTYLSDAKVLYINKKLIYWRLHNDSYLNRTKPSKINTELFKIQLFITALHKKTFLEKIFKTLNYIRKRLIIVKHSNNKFSIEIPILRKDNLL